MSKEHTWKEPLKSFKPSHSLKNKKNAKNSQRIDPKETMTSVKTEEAEEVTVVTVVTEVTEPKEVTEVEEEEVVVTEKFLTQENAFTDQDITMTTLFTLVISVSKLQK